MAFSGKSRCTQAPVDAVQRVIAAACSATVTADWPGVRVLLVDDSDIVRDVSRTLLEEAGLTVDEAHDGAMAVRMAGEPGARYELILMDVQMPVLDGLAATRQIRAALGASAPPIVALTAQASEADWRVCRDSGMLDRVSKPLDPQQLMAALQRWLPQRESAGGAAAVSERILQALPQVPGFDLSAGLQCVSGNTGLLHAMLRRFGAGAGGLAAELRQVIAAENFAEARRAAHNLKGTAATLGGQSIAGVAERLEHALQQRCETGRGDCSALLTELDMVLAQALPALNTLIASPAPVATASTAAMPPQMLQADTAEFEALRQLLAGNCYAARKAFAVLRGKVGMNDAHWRAASVAMDALDFQQALAQLDARYPDVARKAGQLSDSDLSPR